MSGVFLLNLRLTPLRQAVCDSTSQHWGYTPVHPHLACRMGAGDANSGPQACIAVVLPPKHLPSFVTHYFEDNLMGLTNGCWDVV